MSKRNPHTFRQEGGSITHKRFPVKSQDKKGIVIKLSKRDFKKMVDSVTVPPKPNAALIEAMEGKDVS